MTVKPVCPRVGLCGHGITQQPGSDRQQRPRCNHGYSVPLLPAPAWGQTADVKIAAELWALELLLHNVVKEIYLIFFLQPPRVYLASPLGLYKGEMQFSMYMFVFYELQNLQDNKLKVAQM